MNVAQYPSQPGSPPLSNSPERLRDALRRRSARGQVLPLEAAVAQLIPLCTEVAELNSQGYGCYLHPSSILETPGGTLALDREFATQLPNSPEDRACLPPETNPELLNDARACVYSLGAILYELVTGRSVGPGMASPTNIVPTLPKALESIIRATLITDPNCRPDDLVQLANSLHQLTRPGTVPPPAINISAGFRPSQISVDVSLSLLPPSPNAAAPMGPVNNYGVAIQAVDPVIKEAPSSRDQTSIAELKRQLEKDPRPRFFVVKNGMDHGPFTAVELAQHIMGDGFASEDSVVDNVEGKRGPLDQFPQFAPFAEHARRARALRDRQHAIVEVAARDKKSSRGKTLVGVAVMLGMLASGTAWYLTNRGQREDQVAISADRASSIETDGSLAVKKRRGKRRRSRKSGSSSVPRISGGKTCEAARDAYVEVKSMDGPNGPADLTSENYAGVLNSGRYFSHCGVPNSMAVNICAAVQDGKAVGVTVTTRPRNAAKRRCITKAVRNLRFPRHPKLDVTRTSFAAQ